MEIIVDDRERAIFEYLEEASSKYMMNYKIQRNEVGDYAICYKGYILLLIERKTWVDLAASIRDGRKENVQKLLAVREKTGCQVGYLIEGDASPRFDKKYGNLPVKNLRAHLDHLAFRDGIHMFYSKDLEYTASRLFELATNYMSIKEVIKSIDDLESTKDSTTGSNVSELKTKQHCEISIHEQLLRCIPGVGSIISVLLANAGVTLKSLYELEHTPDSIASIQYASGAMIGLDKGTRIAHGTKKVIDSKSASAHKNHVRILATIPLVSKVTAEKILESVSIADIISGNTDVDELANIKRNEKTKLGRKTAENIIKHLCGETAAGVDKSAVKQPETDKPKTEQKPGKLDKSAEQKPSKSQSKTEQPSSKSKQKPSTAVISRKITIKPAPADDLLDSYADLIEDSD